jgi:protein-serine/threonine kinase
LHRLTISFCKSLIRKLLIKDENRRLGSRAGAADVKSHSFFKTTSWALLRHTKPPIVPSNSVGIDTINFRNVKESQSVDISAAGTKSPLVADTPDGEKAVDPFLEFNSITLHHVDEMGYGGYEGLVEQDEERVSGEGAEEEGVVMHAPHGK